MSRTTDAPINPPPAAQDGESPETVQETALQVYNAEVLAATPGAREAFLAMLDLVPEPDADATARIVMAIMGAQTAEELDAAWDAEGMRDYVDQVIRVKGIVKMPSDYAEGLGVFLVCRVDQPHVGEEFILTTGSVSIVAQLVRAHTQGWLPLQVVPRKAAKPSRNGYFPMHLELVRNARRPRAVVIDQPSDAAPQPAARATRS